MPYPKPNLLKTLATAAFCATLPLLAQPPAQQAIQQQAPITYLPTAPSAVLAQQAETLAKKPGSDIVFQTSHTFPGPTSLAGLPIDQPQSGPLKISLDDAITLGLTRNIRILYDEASEREVKGDELAIANALLPSLTFSAATGTQEVNLAAMGFNPALLSKFASIFNIPVAGFSTLVKFDTTDVQIAANQYLFNASAYELYKGARSEQHVVYLNKRVTEGDVVLAVSTGYLKVLADQKTITNAQSQESSSKLNFNQATDRLKAGVGTSLDNLRAQVQYQQDQQTTISAENQLAKDIIQLDRILGIPADQPLQLTDTTPYADLAALPLAAARTTAYAHRKDYLSLIAQLEVEQREFKAAKFQRLPTLAFNGYYGVLGQTTGLYHGVFAATGSLRFPIFNEAEQRGQQDKIAAQIRSLQQRIASDRTDIDAQIRTAMLDVNATAQLVKVARSNVQLAKQELSDERDRFTAGVDTNLPVLDAQASVTGADAQLVNALYQYNLAKLMLARNTGVIESRYRHYLGQ